MPAYVYECNKCETRTEIFHQIDKPWKHRDTSDDVQLVLGDRGLGWSCAKQGCDLNLLTKIIMPVAVKTIVKGNNDFSDRERDRLTKRSVDHWNRVGYKEACERVVAKGHDASVVVKEAKP